MNISAGGIQNVGQLNPQILNATFLVDAVRRDMESLLPQAMQAGSVTVSQTRIQQWQGALQQAVTLLSQIPAPLIFPPPPFVTFINNAVNEINQVLAMLAAIPIASPAIFPPVPGQATISLATLQSLIGHLVRAELFLIQALQTA